MLKSEVGAKALISNIMGPFSKILFYDLWFFQILLELSYLFL